MKLKYMKCVASKKGSSYTVARTLYDITQYCSSITWSGSKHEVARKLQIDLINPINDPHIKVMTLKLGSLLYLYDDDNKEIFRGYIVERERGSNNTVSYTAYDLCFYLLKSKATYKFKKKAPEAIAKAVCSDVKVATGSLAKTGKKYNLLMKDRTIYEVIMAAYTKAKKSTKQKYQLYASKGKVCIRKIGDDWFKIMLSADTNIISSSNKESIADVVNRVKIYDDKGKVLKVVKDQKSIVNYGVFQHTYTKEKDKDPTNSAKAMLRGVTRKMDLELIGYVGCVTGKCVKVKDTASGLEGKYYVESDTHTWRNGVHTMRIELSTTNDMDTQKADTETKSS